MSDRDLEEAFRQLAVKFRRLAKDLRDTGDTSVEPIAGIWDAAARHIENTIRDHNRWHQEPT